MDLFQSEQINELAAAIVKAQLAIVPAVKDHVNPFFKSKYADLPSVWEAAGPFRDNGIAITQSPMDGPDEYIVLDTQLTHVSGQWMRSRLKIRVAKSDPQGYGSALTYARRYSLGCMTGIVTEEDDDGNAASAQPKAQAYTASKQTSQAKINELREQGREEARKPDSGTSAVGPDEHMPEQQQGPPAPSTWRVPKVAWTKDMGGKAAYDLTDEQITFFVQYYEGKVAKDPNSRYRGEWDEALRALVDEAMMREEAKPQLL